MCSYVFSRTLNKTQNIFFVLHIEGTMPEGRINKMTDSQETNYYQGRPYNSCQQLVP
jgi:hypothetical protein